MSLLQSYVSLLPSYGMPDGLMWYCELCGLLDPSISVLAFSFWVSMTEGGHECHEAEDAHFWCVWIW